MKVIDFLINEEVITDKLSMRSKMVLKQNILVCDGNMVKLQFGPISMNPVDNAGEQ